MKWWHGVGIVALLGAGFWIYKAATVVPPGVAMADQGQEHVTPQAVAEFKYNSNPPTSGPHLPTWVKPGAYDTPQSEGELIHSLEHGYVIISYNCNVHLSKIFNFSAKGGSADGRQFSIFNQFPISKIYAHEEDGATPSADFIDPTISTGSAINETDACRALVAQLQELSERKKLFKLVVVPRPQLDTTVALTAWNHIDKFDPPAGGFDAKRIEAFIDYYRDHGPEKTME
ncbi:hypothetical protein A3A64_00690 [Candidatus Gottesmanbacteria bacterium RIFCSPLOWO2_01_FULL_48_11]|uniref:DUF3105 domain-containing protein n=3 Tax=Candidatus Gottesmaniibacteriota TaxID=1752720 RepID=A0A0G1XMX8_9BACT|nr:MAG: hypothetical protein UY16_C0022G0006 [Candidatus Gottesmanbacteria bacterium GW2011_GWA2_47_9]KKU95675.1 MAG: hypothetical protein UY27_C0011G0011 [Candidatus Gottesmanbacteria bacterium GW2011_GWA1_48_13]OGG28241.1 MAG: hypothetical protein A3A64_00690 [Candidatus Gottesmanbacteria bacterium RIFCSPLOWO2_01_FULL_48_11]